MSSRAASRDGRPPARRDQIRTVAAELFARHGFHGVSMDDLGAAVGVSGPALYRHFPGKEAILAEMLVQISEHLLAGATVRAAGAASARRALEDLVDFHVAFAMESPELITVQDRELDNVPVDDRHRVRALQRAYVEVWVGVLRQLVAGLSEGTARAAAHGVFGLLNSTPHSTSVGEPGEVAALLRRMALVALTTPGALLPGGAMDAMDARDAG